MFRLFHDVHTTLPGPYNLMILLVDVGTVLWLVAYLLSIWQGFKEKTYSIPIVAVCLCFTWEILAATVMQAPIKLWVYGDIFWMCLDSVIVYQVFRYGRARQVIPEIRRWYYPILVCSFVLALLGQYLFTVAFGDWLGFEDSYLINFVMSVLFVFMYFNRREAGNLTYGIAWAKMLGTGIISVALVWLFPVLYPTHVPQVSPFMHLLYVACAGVDLIYVTLLAHARRVPAVQADSADLAPVVT
jgi:hypothetical protein